MNDSIKNHPSSENINTLFNFITEYTADSVEWCPHQPFQNYFVCANYQLSNEKNAGTNAPKRLGKILMFSITPENGLVLLQTINTEGVLDQKWCHNKINNFSILGVVDANKGISIYKLNFDIIQLELITRFVIEDEHEENLILSLDWSTGKYSSSEPDIICSDSKGNIHRLKLRDNQLSLEENWHAHEFEAWISAFYYWNTNIVLTGGDDCVLQKFDRRVGAEPISKNKSAGAGVTCIHSNFNREHIVVTGSYDSFARLWDVRKFKHAVCEVTMPGTLWRVKWDPFHANFVLAACMLGGVHVIDFLEEEQGTIAESYYEHTNISYGADWCHLNQSEVKKFNFDGERIIGTCSFYDRLLCVAKIKLSQ